ncbi:MAG TPA: hypothetical protein VLY45_07845 [Nitrospiria bacterium]|nr:hypothetical protein [Nitrospiria bacterium]
MQDTPPLRPHEASQKGAAVEKWVWKLFTGDAYPYIRRSLQQHHGRPPTAEEIRSKFFDVYCHCSVKIMVMELVGLGLEFQDLASFPYGTDDFAGLMADPTGYLSRGYGGGKYKLSFYYGEQFFATQNFKVGGQPRWNMGKCLVSIIEAMEEKDRGARPPSVSYAQLIERLCLKHGLSPDAVITEKSAFLRLIRLTAGNQYEDYLSILLNSPESSELVGLFNAQLDELHARRSPAAGR